MVLHARGRVDVARGVVFRYIEEDPKDWKGAVVFFLIVANILASCT